MAEISAEQQVLFKLLKGDLSFQADEFDPDRLFNLFQRHRLFPLASPIIALLNEENKNKWKSAIQTRSIKSLQQTSVLGRLYNAFRSRGIEAIPLKGPLLAQTLYGDIGSRHSIDLDLLIRGENIELIIEIAHELGFVLRFPKPGLTSSQWRYYFKYKKDIGLFNQDQGVFLELHTSIDNRNLIRSTEEYRLWKDLSEVSIGGSTYKALNNNNTFIYLTFHGALHQYTRLFWLRDVAEALGQWDLDHQKILANAKLLGIERLLGVSLVLAEEHFNKSIPSDYSEYIKSNHRIIQLLARFANQTITGPENLSFGDKIIRQRYRRRLKSGLNYQLGEFSGIFHRWYIRKFLGGH